MVDHSMRTRYQLVRQQWYKNEKLAEVDNSLKDGETLIKATISYLISFLLLSPALINFSSIIINL